MHHIVRQAFIYCSFIILLSSCSSVNKDNKPYLNLSPLIDSPSQVGHTNESCYFPDAKDAIAPYWVCTPPPLTSSITAVGTAKKSNQGFAYSKQLATTSARWMLAQQIETRISEAITTYTKSNHQDDTEYLYHSIIQQTTQQTLVGSKILKSQLSPKQTLYILMGIDKQQAKKLIETSFQASYLANKDLWDQLLSTSKDSAFENISISATN